MKIIKKINEKRRILRKKYYFCKKLSASETAISYHRTVEGKVW